MDFRLVDQSEQCEPEWVEAGAPAFLLYTSGSTGTPKGVQHATGGYLLHAALTCAWTFDLKPEDVFCTADIGWVTGHTYIAYGPLAPGATAGGVFSRACPRTPTRALLEDDQDHRVTVFYTAPTAIRLLIKAAEGNEAVRTLPATVSPACASSARWANPSTRPPGAVPPACGRRAPPHRRHLLADRDRRPHDHAAARRDYAGARLVQHPALPRHRGGGGRRNGQRPALWPGRHPGRQAAVAVDDLHHLHPERFRKGYYPEEFQGCYYLAGDGAIRDAKTGYFTITGRIDDVLNVSGHRMGTMEIESALGRQDRPGSRGRGGGPPRRHHRRGDLRLRRVEAPAPHRRGSQGHRQRTAQLGGQGTAPSPSPRTSASATTWPGRAAARSCGACCARSPRARRSRRTRRPWRIRRVLEQRRPTDSGMKRAPGLWDGRRQLRIR